MNTFTVVLAKMLASLYHKIHATNLVICFASFVKSIDDEKALFFAIFHSPPPAQFKSLKIRFQAILMKKFHIQ